MTHLKHLSTGIRLHFNYFYLKVTGKLGEGFYFHFPSIEIGLKGEKVANRAEIKFYSIPIPNQIFSNCGVGLVATEKNSLLSLFKKEKIPFQIYFFDGKQYRLVEDRFDIDK